MKVIKNVLRILLVGLKGGGKIFCLLLMLFSCNDKIDNSKQSRLKFVFEHHVDNSPIILNTQRYINAAGNSYILQEIKYFISSICLYRNDGAKTIITQNDGIHYVDVSLDNTLIYDIFQNITEGVYDSISFIFGLDEMNNQSYRFRNPPESNMAWSQVLGGGYHYLMLNGWFYRGDTTAIPLNIHLGRGQIYQGATMDTDSIIGFVDNYFHVNLPKTFLIRDNETTTINIVMDINKWFDEPFIYDFNTYGSHIMQNQTAMQAIKSNGYNVFF